MVRFRPKTLRGAVALYAFALEAVLLAGAFAAIDTLLGRELDRDLHRNAASELAWLEAFMADHARGGRDYLVEEMQEHLGARAGVLIQIEEHGKNLFRSRELAGARLPEDGAFTDAQGRPWRSANSRFESFSLNVAVSAAGAEQARRTLRRVMAVCFAAGLLVAALLARALARTASAPLTDVAAASERIHAGNLTERLRSLEPGYAEVERLAASFNRMLDRLESTIHQIRRFTADASHELRTPLAILTSQAQSALGSGELQPEAAALFTSQLEEVERLKRMVEDLLLLSRAEAGPRATESVDLADLIIESVEKLRSLFEAKALDLAMGTIDSTLVRGAPAELSRVVTNLLDNALKYTDPGGRVRVELRRADGVARLDVSDTGRGITAEDLPRIFDRFYRADPSRSRETGGSGLGLAIVARIVAMHGGKVAVDSRPGEGTRFTIELPTA